MEGAAPPTGSQGRASDVETPSTDGRPPQTPEAALAMEFQGFHLDVEAEVGSSTKSALETEVVLEHLFDFLRTPDLCSARQVCRLWNQEAIPLLKKKSPPINIRIDNFEGSANVDIRKLTACIQWSAGRFPFTNLALSRDMIRSPGDGSIPWNLWNGLLEAAAPWLTSFSLDPHLRLTLPPGTTFPQLSALEFRTSVHETSAFFLHVVENAPNLKDLDLNDWNMDSSCLRQLCKVKGLQLKELSLSSYLPTYYPGDMREEYWRNLLTFLDSQRNSLQSLHWGCGGFVQAALPNFIFPELRYLSMFWTSSGRGTLFRDPLQYAHTFPNLRSLRLTIRPGWRDWELVFRKQKPVSSVTHLSITGLCDLVSQQLFRENAPTLFPCVAKLEICQSDRIVWKVLELVTAFQKLQELSLGVRGITGLAMTLTGGTRQESRNLVRLRGELALRKMEEHWRPKITQEESYVALQRFRKLEIAFPGDLLECGLSESLCRLLRILVPNLKVLCLAWRWAFMWGPRPLPKWMAEMERDTTIIFN